MNSGYQTDKECNNQFYSIGVYVNGTLYQKKSENHTNLRSVSRAINWRVNLAIGDFVEIFVENYQSVVNIDSYFKKIYFEIKQIK